MFAFVHPDELLGAIPPATLRGTCGRPVGLADLGGPFMGKT